MVAKMIETLEGFCVVIHEMDADQFKCKLDVLQQASIGEHTRHIIECYQELLKGYEEGRICYDDRKREVQLQSNPDAACQAIKEIINLMTLPDKDLMLKTSHLGHPSELRTTYYRELLYNFEHMIHHQALIRIGMNKMCLNTKLENSFGVAPATIAYRNHVYG